jgi:hypothetical protein
VPITQATLRTIEESLIRSALRRAGLADVAATASQGTSTSFDTSPDLVARLLAQAARLGAVGGGGTSLGVLQTAADRYPP